MRRRDLLTSLGGFLYRCNIPLTSHRDFIRDPASPNGSRFFLALRSEKLRQAQDDRLIAGLVIFVKNGRFVNRPYKVSFNSALPLCLSVSLAFYFCPFVRVLFGGGAGGTLFREKGSPANLCFSSFDIDKYIYLGYNKREV